MIRALAIGLAISPAAASAFEPALPDGAQPLADERSAPGHYAVPSGPFASGEVPADRLSGAVWRRSWRVESGFTGTGALAAALGGQLSAEGWDIVFSCDDELCGGFDFRFNTEVLLPPEMFVDLGDYYFLSALRDGAEGAEGVGVLISRTAQAGMVQVITVTPRPLAVPEASDSGAVQEGAGNQGDGAVATPVAPAEVAALRPEVVVEGNVLEWLERTGHIVLSDLVFETGSSRLGAGPFRSLEALAAFLNEDKTRRIALVGHTDSVGSLEQNTELSRRRAAAVMARLVETFGVARGQLEARGVGYLSPIASNLGDEGRAANRRVEAVLLNTE